jgi:hypothetical protein
VHLLKLIDGGLSTNLERERELHESRASRVDSLRCFRVSASPALTEHALKQLLRLAMRVVELPCLLETLFNRFERFGRKPGTWKTRRPSREPSRDLNKAMGFLHARRSGERELIGGIARQNTNEVERAACGFDLLCRALLASRIELRILESPPEELVAPYDRPPCSGDLLSRDQQARHPVGIQAHVDLVRRRGLGQILKLGYPTDGLMKTSTEGLADPVDSLCASGKLTSPPLEPLSVGR